MNETPTPAAPAPAYPAPICYNPPKPARSPSEKYRQENTNLTPQIPVHLRRLRKKDIAEVVEIEREAFSPTWISSPFKRDLNNKHASYLVAVIEPDPNEPAPDQPGAGQPANSPAQPENRAAPPTPPAEPAPAEPDADAPPLPRSWLARLAGRFRITGAPPEPPPPENHAIAGYVSVWYQGDEAHIVEIAVRHTLRGHGIGELLLIGSLRAARARGSRVMTLEARVSNFIAQRLYEKYNFQSVGIRKGYYSDNREDAVIMTTTPINAAEYARLFRTLQQTWQSRWGPINIQE